MSNFSETLANFNKQTGTARYSTLESQDNESLLGSFRQRASESISSFMETNPDKECFGLTTMQRYIGFMAMLGSSALFFMISLFTLPMILVVPAKFALTWTMASILFLSSYSILNGWKAHVKHLFCWDRAAFTGSYLGSMAGTLYFSVVSPRYIPVLVFIILQVIALAWYLASYIPGGTSGLKWMTRATVGLPV